jgi:hypothetical protein
MLPAFLIGPAAKYIGAPVAIALLAWGGYAFIHHRGVADCERDHNQALVESIKRAAAQAREIALQDAEVLYSTYRTVERIRTVYREREQGVKDAVHQDCRLCALSPDGLKLLNDALTNGPAGSDDTVGAPPGVPHPHTAPSWQFPGSGREIGGYSRQIL